MPNTYIKKVHGIIDNVIFHHYPSYISYFLQQHLDMYMTGYHDYGGHHKFFIQNQFFTLLHQQADESFTQQSYEEFYKNAYSKKIILTDVNFAAVAKSLNIKYETFRRCKLEMAKEDWFKFGSNTVEFTRKLIDKRSARNKVWITSHASYLHSILKLIAKYFDITLSIQDVKSIEEKLKEYYENSILDYLNFTKNFINDWTEKLFDSFESYVVFNIIFLNQIRRIDYENDKRGLGLDFNTMEDHFYDIPPPFAMSASSIAESCGFSRSTVTRHLARLEKKNLIIKLGNLNDKVRSTLAESYPLSYNPSTKDRLSKDSSGINKILGGQKSYLIKGNTKAISERTNIRKSIYHMKVNFLTKQFIRLNLLTEENLEQIATSKIRFTNPTQAYDGR